MIEPKDTNQRTIKYLLIFLEGLTVAPSRLSAGKLNAEKLKTCRLIIEGWKILAGDAADHDSFLTAVETIPNVLIKNLRQNPKHRPSGSKTRTHVETDNQIIAMVRAGSELKIAIIQTLGHARQLRTHSVRIKNKMKEQDAETASIIALQSAD